ncbi:MAG: hotdog family protein [Moraxellaceae bacterium]|nr:hotdog family protein [Moraxellaceae bacterium]
MQSHSILDLIPHRPPMVLLDEILEQGPEHMRARMRVSNDKMFVDVAGNFPAWAGIELMAQTIAAYGGFQARAQGLPVQVGFLLGTRRYESECAHFPPGTELTISVHKLLIDEQGLGVFECRIDSEAGAISANLNIYQPLDPDTYLQQGQP